MIVAQASVVATWPAVAPDDVNFGDPAQLLRDARRDHAQAQAAMEKANAAYTRATTMLADLETQLSQFRGGDDQVTEAAAQAFRDGANSGDLPWHLEQALRDRSRCLGRSIMPTLQNGDRALSRRRTAGRRD